MAATRAGSPTRAPALVLLLLALAAGFPMRATAQAVVEGGPENLEAREAGPLGRWTVSVIGIAGQNFARTFHGAPDKGFSEMGMAAVEAGKFVSRRLEIGLAVQPLMVISQPRTRAGEGRESVDAFAADLVARWYPCPFSWRVRPYVEIAEGLLYSLRRVPSTGTRFNVLGQLGSGLTFSPKGRWAFVVGYRWVHISNAGLGEHNPSWNYHGLALGGRLYIP